MIDLDNNVSFSVKLDIILGATEIGDDWLFYTRTGVFRHSPPKKKPHIITIKDVKRTRYCGECGLIIPSAVLMLMELKELE